ncbi:hypothetical protein BAE44_0015998 [Dichanthelium oligosanthes]|uniref:Uncharacterized protein n=1 Tax=Dichanthelium oligosanthes TaxID=888268 RepID=A0A1E5VCV2_9POAL|nr:hypothetical protein BAE44_0015998 [Dichanthelium oligosanthes]
MFELTRHVLGWLNRTGPNGAPAATATTATQQPSPHHPNPTGHGAVAAGADGGPRRRYPAPRPAGQARAPRPRRPRLQALAPDPSRPGLPPPLSRVPPRPAPARLPPHIHGEYRLVPTTYAAAVAFSPPPFACERSLVLDCRHGRVLIHSIEPMGIFVWDPVSGQQKHLPLPPFRYAHHMAAVLCASDGCDHLGCHGGPFLVVFAGTSTGIDRPERWFGERRTAGWEPSVCKATARIHLWLSPAASSFDGEWVQGRVIELDMMIPVATDDPSTKLKLVGFAEGTGTIFISTNARVFALEVKTGQVRKVADSGVSSIIFPYVSFYTPGLSIQRNMPDIG